MAKITCEEAKEQIDLVDYLEDLGHRPTRISRDTYTYHSPLREDRTPSFTVSRSKNIWYDHGTGQGGTIIDFGLAYFECTIPELLDKLEYSPLVHPRALIDYTSSQIDEGKVLVIKEDKLSSPALLHYLAGRRIPTDIATHYCSQVHYQINKKDYFAIGFKNRSGGYELRNTFFKGSSSPKDVTFIDNGSERLSVFEGFIDFLSYVFIQQNERWPATNFLILNSSAQKEKGRTLFAQHKEVHLYLDTDEAGRNATLSLMESGSYVIDGSAIYKEFKDMNEWLNRPVKS